MKKKSAKTKASKKRAAKGPEIVDLVSVMTKLVERLEILERKSDQILGRVSNLPSEFRNAIQNISVPSQHSHQRSHAEHEHNGGRKDRVLYKAICADCFKNCEVPFKPTGRPVYCKECWAIRKAGHKPQDPDQLKPQQKNRLIPGPTIESLPPGSKTILTASVLKRKKKKPARKSAKRR